MFVLYHHAFWDPILLDNPWDTTYPRFLSAVYMLEGPSGSALLATREVLWVIEVVRIMDNLRYSGNNKKTWPGQSISSSKLQEKNYCKLPSGKLT